LSPVDPIRSHIEMTIRPHHGATLIALLATLPSCKLISLPPAGSRDDGGPVAARGEISHEARSHVRLYRDATGCESVQTVNRRFRVVTVVSDSGPERLVLEEAYDVRECLDTESSSSEATITAWRPAAGVTAPIFTIRARGMRGRPTGNLYQLTGHSCCGSGELDSYYSLLTGRALFAASGPLLQLQNSAIGDRRFAAVHDSYSAGAPPESLADSTVVGVLQWGGDREPAWRVVVVTDRPEPFALTEIGFYRGGQPIPDAVLADADPGIELRFRLAATASERSIDVRIPIAGLDLALDRASVLGGASLRPGR
jgi:hypothetical protein